MTLNRNELKKIIYSFNSISNRLLQANCADYNSVLLKFLRFLDDTEIISDYIRRCGIIEESLEEAFSEVTENRAIFLLGDTIEDEVGMVYAILNYIVDNNVNIPFTIGQSYSNSRNTREVLKDFNDRVTLVLINHIQNYLISLGIDMGLDDRIEYNISVETGQVNIANDRSTINAQFTIDEQYTKALNEQIIKIEKELDKTILSDEDLDIYESSISSLKDFVSTRTGSKNTIKNAWAALRSIKGSIEFAAAVATLGELISQII